MTLASADHDMRPPGPTRGWRLAVFFAAWPIATGAAAALGAAGGFTAPATIMLGIVFLAAMLWVSEAVSAMATGLLVVALCVALLGLPATFGATWALAAPRITGWEQFIAPAGSEVMLLLLGSMTLGVAVHLSGLDRIVGERALGPFMGNARRLALGLMLASAFMSLWMSNTATAAIMLALARGLSDRYPPPGTDGPGTHGPGTAQPDVRVVAGFALAVALGANVGGIASPVGTPPGAIVFTRLRDMGEPVTFLGWMAIGVPIAAVLLTLGWFAMTRVLDIPPATPRADAPFPAGAGNLAREHAPRTGTGPLAARRITSVVFIVTIALWLTGGLTGLPVEAAALVPLCVLPLAGVVRPRDMALIDWDVLLLILGGLVLGTGMELSGLAEQAVATLPMGTMPPASVVVLAALAALVLSAFMSNTATANLLAPIALGIAASMAVSRSANADTPGGLVFAAGFAVALGAGASMALAVATPANALAARDGITPRQFLIVGTTVGVGVLAATAVLARVLV